MRHTAVLEFTREITVDEKLIFFNGLKTDEELSYTDVSSANNNTQITTYFSSEDGDKSRIIFESKKIEINTLLSFDRLVSLYGFTLAYFEGIVVDLLNPVEPEHEDPDPPLITA